MLIRILNRLFHHELFDGDGRCEYMDRWDIAKLAGFAVYLQRFLASDWSRDPHDHPRPFVSIGLWGRYTEHIYHRPPTWVPDEERPWIVQEVEYRAPWVRWIRPTHTHRVVLEPGETCWTLLIGLRKCRAWGFWASPDRWLSFDDYFETDRPDTQRDC